MVLTIGPNHELHVFAFSNPNSGSLADYLFKILKSCATFSST